jgi:hypothetical protein
MEFVMRSQEREGADYGRLIPEKHQTDHFILFAVAMLALLSFLHFPSRQAVL